MVHLHFGCAYASVLATFLVADAHAIIHGDCMLDTPNGYILGHPSNVQPEVCEFLGIPYAAAPVGKLRFAPPEAKNLTSDFIADTWGADCPQNPSSLFAYPNATPWYSKVFTSFVSTTTTNNNQSEDCLKLNIWVKASVLNNRQPVLMWIHGGRHNSGTSNTPFYNGANFAAAENAAFVTFNFRMNIFGFPGAPEGTQNVGLLDHYAAVQWVHDNFLPTNIAIFGQSSGAAAVANWAYAFKEKALVAAVASHSGNQFSFPTNTLELATSNWYNVTSALGCGASGITLECMQSPNITFQQILAAAKKVPTIPTSSPTRSQPQFQVTQDNKTWFSNEEYLARVKSGNLARMPYLQIHGDHESGFYRISALAQGNNLTEDTWQDFERETFTCASAAEAFYRSQLNIPNYRVRNMADWGNTRLYDPPSSGAYHGVEIHMVTGNSELVSGIPPTAAQVNLTMNLASCWSAFAADPVNGLITSCGWPPYQPSAATLGLVGPGNSADVEFVDAATYDTWCPAADLDYWDDAIPIRKVHWRTANFS